MNAPAGVSSRKFVFYPGLTIASAIALIILIILGTWQLHRREWKLDLIATIEARITAEPQSLASVIAKFNSGEDMRYTRVNLRGRFDHASESHIFGTIGPVPGYYIFTPMILERSPESPSINSIYINRGFVPQELKSVSGRSDGQVDDIIEVTGLFREKEQRRGIAKWFEPVDDPEKNIWYTRDPERFAAFHELTNLTTQPWYIDSSGIENKSDYPRGNTTRIEFNNRHLEYALTWYGLGATLIGVWIAFSWRRDRD